jgi:cyclopropane fatty-acyl-phospholipid synthase-like methyltransferase
MLQLAKLKKDEVVFDLGCGDGRVLIEAAQQFEASAVGIELDAGRYRECLRKIKEERLEDRVTVIHGNLLEVDLKQADVVTLYLLTSANDKLRPNLEKQLKNGARVVSHDFPISSWTAKKVEKIQENWGSHTLYLYAL